MHLPRQLLLLALCLPPTFALHQSDVGVVDWYKGLVGVPLTSSISTSPVFHRVIDHKESTKSVVLTATGSNVLAALNPVNGSVAWRYIYEPDDRIIIFQKHKNVVASLSGPGGATLRTFDVLTGHLLLEKRMHTPGSGQLSEPDNLGTAVAFSPGGTPKDKSLFALTNGYSVRHVDGKTGEIKWHWTSPDQTSLVIYSKIVATRDAIYVIGLTKSFSSYTLHIEALSPESGESLTSKDVHSSISGGSSDIISLYDPDQNARVVWLEQGTIKCLSLTTDLRVKASSTKYATYVRITDVGLSSQGIFMATKQDGTNRVMKLDAAGSGVIGIWDFEGSASSDVYTESMYAGGFDKDGFPYIARVYWSHVLKAASAEILAPHLADGKGLVTGFSFPFDTHKHGIIHHVAVDAANPAEYRVLGRIVITSTTGAVQLWQQDKLQWVREESLSSIGVAEFVELPETKIGLFHVGDQGETFVARLTRQFSDAQNFPQYLVNFIRRFATGSYASVSSVASAADDGALSRDAFGFRQVIVAATTPFGKVYGIDSSNGKILWSRVLGLGRANEAGGRIIPVHLFVTRTVRDNDVPQVVLVTQRRSHDSHVDTVLFHIDALTGEDARGESSLDDVLQGVDTISGPLVEAYLLNRTVLLVDEFLRIHLYPNTSENQKAFKTAVPSLHFPLRTVTNGRRRLLGHKIIHNPSLSEHFVAYPTWTGSLPAEEDIQALIPSVRGPIANIGKVLGNRTTLYKYLNPHLFVILTASHSVAPSTCGIYLVDSVKGSIIYHASLPSRNGVCDVKASLSENWLVYHYYDGDFAGIGSTKGYRMVTVELYEGTHIDDKTKSSELSSFSNATLDVTAYTQAYISPFPITAMSPTSTKFGITAKDIIVACRNHQIHSLPHRFLDPRRPNRKVTAEEQEEFLISYDPILLDDPRRVLSHNYEVAHIERIVTAPALLESTSLVFAYGLDLFFTRVAPSNTFDVLSENFNKLQLVLTVSGLAVAIIVTKPMVRRKYLREKWYQYQ